MPRLSKNTPETEGRAFQRIRAFAAQRFAILHEPGMPPTRRAAAPPGEAALPADFRRNLVNEYRMKQRMHAPPVARLTRDMAPQPPSAPPACNWVPIGPAVVRRGQAANRPPVSGRVSGIAIGPGGARVYAGSANGGVWRSDDGGATWVSTMDAWDVNPTNKASDSLSCGAIAVSPADQQVIYVGSGEGDNVWIWGGSVVGTGAYFGVGPLRSGDGGVNWETEPTAAGSPALAGKAFYRLAVDPGDPGRVIGATTAGLYRRQPNGSGGFEWAQKQAGIFTSVVAARSGGTTTFYAAKHGGGIFRSTDGDTWTTLNTGFPTTNVGRIGLAVQSSNPNTVYALVHNKSTEFLLGVWRLETSDNTWKVVSGAPADLFGGGDVPGQGSYDLAIVVDPNNVDRIYLGGSTKWFGSNWCSTLYRCAVTSSGGACSMTTTYIGGDVHPDVHTLEFVPGDSDKLFVGCDGGVFYTGAASGGATFEARNTGLATMTVNHIGLHPSQDAVVFTGTQDNGITRYTGEEAWLHSAAGDGGFAVVNWNDPYKVLRTYVLGMMEKASDGGKGYTSWTDASLPASEQNKAEFYAPIAGTPQHPGFPAEADVVAFGGQRPWISTDFGSNWQSIPNNSAADALPANILSLVFASATKLYAGTLGGQVYRFTQSGGAWTRTAIQAAPLLVGPVTSIAVDPADATGNSIYVTLGGTGDYRHVWHYDGANWAQRSGPAAGSATSVLDVQHNAVVVDPANTSHIYVGADIGIWRSKDGGTSWAPLSDGLPDAAVLDIKLNNARRLLIASTHGRGVFERRIEPAAPAGVELFLRDTQLDRGLYTTVDGLNDPTQPGVTVAHWAGPGIKVDAPSSAGTYQTPASQIDFFQFTDTIVDGSGGVATVDPSVGVAHNRVYVEVRNRGVVPANDVQVMVLLANASLGLPNLPSGYQTHVQNGTAISTADWKTVGFKTLNNLRAGFPQIASFDLPSTMLPPPASLGGNAHHCLLALLHSPDDTFTNTELVVDTLSPTERKAAHKNLHVVQFTGTLPPAPPPPQWVTLKVHGLPDKEFVGDLVLELAGYSGAVRLILPETWKFAGDPQQSVSGFRKQDFPAAAEFVAQRVAQLRGYIERKTFDPQWTKDLIAAIDLLRGQPVLLVADSKRPAVLKQFVVPAGKSYTILLGLERPKQARVGNEFDFRIYQRDSRTEQVLGGSTFRVQVVKEAPRKVLRFKIWGTRVGTKSETVNVRMLDEAETVFSPAEGVEVGLILHTRQGPEAQPHAMAYNARSRAFTLRVEKLPHVKTGVVKVTAVAKYQGTETRETQTVDFTRPAARRAGAGK